MTSALILGYLTIATGVTFIAFGLDKRAARNRTWRISEATLLALSLCGGWVGAKAAQRLLTHKSRKQPFGRVLNAIPLMWCAAALLGAALMSQPPPSETATVTQTERVTPKYFQSVAD